MPNHDITLKANYSNLSSLYLHYSFPNNYHYDENKFADINILKTGGSNIENDLIQFASKLNDLNDLNNNKLEVSPIYSVINDQEVLFNSTLMPEGSMYLHINIKYTSIISLITYLSDIDYSIDLTSSYLNSKQTNINISSIFPQYQDDLINDGSVYIYEGLYLDNNFINRYNSDTVDGSSSSISAPEFEINRLMVKGIRISFIGEYNTIGYVIPNSLISNNVSRLCYLFNVQSIENLKFYVVEHGVEYELNNQFPSDTSVVKIEKINIIFVF